MSIQKFSFMSTTGTTLILECEFEERQGSKMYKSITLPEGRKTKPKFAKGEDQLYFFYKGNRWYLLS